MFLCLCIYVIIHLTYIHLHLRMSLAVNRYNHIGTQYCLQYKFCFETNYYGIVHEAPMDSPTRRKMIVRCLVFHVAYTCSIFCHWVLPKFDV